MASASGYAGLKGISMNSKNDDVNVIRTGIWEALGSLGLRNILTAMAVIIITVVALSFGFYALYSSVKESISLRSEINARQFSKGFDEYLLTGLNNIKMASYSVDTCTGSYKLYACLI